MHFIALAEAMARYKECVMENVWKEEPQKVKPRMLEYVRAAGLPRHYAELSRWTPPRFPVRGSALVERLALSPSPIVARVTNALRDRWRDSRYSLDEAALLELAPSVLERVRAEKPPPRPPRTKHAKGGSKQGSGSRETSPERIPQQTPASPAATAVPSSPAERTQSPKRQRSN